MKVLVTGANGLIGANIVRDLLGRGVRVRGVVRAGSDLAALAGLEVELFTADVRTDRAMLERASRGCRYLFHTALQFTYDRRRTDELEAVALRGTENVLRAAAAAGVGRVVVTSSSVVFGHGTSSQVRDESHPPTERDGDNAYVRAKIRQHLYSLELAGDLGMDVVAVCPTVSVGAHGTRLGPSNGFVVAYLSDPLRTTFPGGGNVVAAADVAAGHWLAAQRGEAGAQYILGSENLEWRAAHELVAELAGVEPPRVLLNHTLAYLAGGAEELRAMIGRRAPLSNRVQASMVGRYYWYDDARARRLGYAPRPARRALAEALSWLATTPHVSRELRCSLRLHDDVYAARLAAAGMH